MRSHLTLPGFNGRYRIYTTGKVWDKHLKVFLIARPNSTGYLRVRLYDGKRYFIHRLVALTFLPNPNNYPIVMHKDNNPENNRVGNLKWGTQSQNMKQMVNEGRQRKSKIINYKSEVLTLHSQGFSIPEIIKSVGISKTSVHRIIKGKL